MSLQEKGDSVEDRYSTIQLRHLGEQVGNILTQNF